MPETLFVADLHLHASRPAVLALFLEFLENRAARADGLYILGDLFEAWLGDDDDDPLCATVKSALARLAARGVPVGTLHGNRDFLLGERFARETGCRLLPDPSVVDLYGRPALLMHGDTLCTADVAYQAFRRQVRDPLWQQQFLAKPLAERRAVAQALRAQSRAATQSKAEEIMDVTPQAVLDALRAHRVERLIHGHTHRPAIHRFDLDGKSARRMVVGDWHSQGSVLACDAQDCRLESL